MPFETPHDNLPTPPPLQYRGVDIVKVRMKEEEFSALRKKHAARINADWADGTFNRGTPNTISAPLVMSKLLAHVYVADHKAYFDEVPELNTPNRNTTVYPDRFKEIYNYERAFTAFPTSGVSAPVGPEPLLRKIIMSEWQQIFGSLSGGNGMLTHVLEEGGVWRLKHLSAPRNLVQAILDLNSIYRLNKRLPYDPTHTDGWLPYTQWIFEGHLPPPPVTYPPEPAFRTVTSDTRSRTNQPTLSSAPRTNPEASRQRGLTANLRMTSDVLALILTRRGMLSQGQTYVELNNTQRVSMDHVFRALLRHIQPSSFNGEYHFDSDNYLEMLNAHGDLPFTATPKFVENMLKQIDIMYLQNFQRNGEPPLTGPENVIKKLLMLNAIFQVKIDPNNPSEEVKKIELIASDDPRIMSRNVPNNIPSNAPTNALSNTPGQPTINTRRLAPAADFHELTIHNGPTNVRGKLVNETPLTSAQLNELINTEKILLVSGTVSQSKVSETWKRLIDEKSRQAENFLSEHGLSGLGAELISKSYNEVGRIAWEDNRKLAFIRAVATIEQLYNAFIASPAMQGKDEAAKKSDRENSIVPRIGIADFKVTGPR